MAFFKCVGCHEWRFLPNASLKEYFSKHWLCPQHCQGWERAGWASIPSHVTVLGAGKQGRILFPVGVAK